VVLPIIQFYLRYSYFSEQRCCELSSITTHCNQVFNIYGILLVFSCCAVHLFIHLSVQPQQGSTYDRYVGPKITTAVNAHAQHPVAEDEGSGNNYTESNRGRGRGVSAAKFHGTFGGSTSTRTRNKTMSSMKAESVTSTMSSLTRSLGLNMTMSSRRTPAPAEKAAGAAVSVRAEKPLTPLEMLEADMGGSDDDDEGDDDDLGEMKTTTHGATLPFPTANLSAVPGGALDEVLEEKRKSSTTVLKDLNFCPYHGSLLQKRLKDERAAASRSKVSSSHAAFVPCELRSSSLIGGYNSMMS